LVEVLVHILLSEVGVFFFFSFFCFPHIVSVYGTGTCMQASYSINETINAKTSFPLRSQSIIPSPCGMEPTSHLAVRKIHLCLAKWIAKEKSNQELAGNNRKTPDVPTARKHKSNQINIPKNSHLRKPKAKELRAKVHLWPNQRSQVEEASQTP